MSTPSECKNHASPLQGSVSADHELPLALIMVHAILLEPLGTKAHNTEK